jgi:hypothetical protein
MSQRRGPDDGGTPPGDGDLPDLPPPWSDLVVPDDPRELAAEAAEVRAELARERRQLRWRRLFRSGLSIPFVALLLLLVAAMSSLIIVVTPVSRRLPEAAPQGTPTGDPGSIGGLLPDLVLSDARDRPVQLRTVRPAVVLLMPPGCGCAAVAAELVVASRETMVHVELVGGDTAPGLPNGSADARVEGLADPDQNLARALTASPPGPVAAARPEPTAILVRADGVIARIVGDVSHPRDLRNDMAALTA